MTTWLRLVQDLIKQQDLNLHYLKKGSLKSGSLFNLLILIQSLECDKRSFSMIQEKRSLFNPLVVEIAAHAASRCFIFGFRLIYHDTLSS
ncbi:MAG: hypothetical protein RLZZ435_3210 [Cyanobacteriota bacterium]|jgi:hypothetical protein